MTTITVPLTTTTLQGLVPDVVRSCIVQQPSPPPDPGETPPPPVTEEGIYTPVAPGVVYENLPTVTIVDTSPNQMIGCIIDTADNPQGRLNALFPAAIDGDGVIERSTNDIWVFDGTTWENVGPTPGPTIITATIIPPWNEILKVDGTVRSKLAVASLPYALEQLTEPAAYGINIGLNARKVLLVKTPSTNLLITAEAPAVSSGGGVSVIVPEVGVTLNALEDIAIGPPKLKVFVPSANLNLLAPTPSVATGVTVDASVSSITLTAFAPAVGYKDIYFNNVSLLLTMNGSNGSTTFTDLSSNSFTVNAVGNTQISTAQSKFGGSSAYFDGTGDGLSVASNSAFGFGTGAFTVEFFAFLTVNGAPSATTFFDFRTNITAIPWTFYVANNGAGNRIGIYYATGTSFAEWNGSGPFLSLNQWYHIALVRDGSTYKIFVDGTQATLTAGSASAVNLGSSNPCYIGIGSNGSVGPYTGYIDELRITKGVARYTANFAPPSMPFPNQ